MKRLTLLSLAGLILATLTGCQAMMHEMQPHRLWRLNYQPKSNNSDGSYGAYFSVNDSLNDPTEPHEVHGKSFRESIQN